MKSKRPGRTSQLPRSGWVSVMFIFVLVAAAASPEFLGGRTARAVITTGPSVRVTPTRSGLCQQKCGRASMKFIRTFDGGSDAKAALSRGAPCGTLQK